MHKPTRRCSVCGAHVHQATITSTQPIGEAVSLVAGVPAQVCRQCGETYLSPETVDALQHLMQTHTAAKTLTVPV